MINRILYIFIFTIALSLFGTISSNAQVKVKSVADKNSIVLGQEVQFSLSAEHPSKTFLIWPSIGENIAEKVEIIQRLGIDTVFSNNKENVTLKERFVITSYDSGSYTIPAYRFQYVEGNDTLEAFSDSLNLYVNTVPVDTSKGFKDIKGPVEIPFDWREMLPKILIIFGCVVFLVLLIWFLIYKLRKKKTVVYEKPMIKEPAHLIAYRDLESLKNKKLWQENKVKLYYTELIDIIRVYIENRYGIDASEMTSDEIYSALLLTEASRPESERLNTVLILSDLVKFAKANPGPTEHEQAFENCKLFVQNTAVIISATNTEPKKGGEA